MVSRRTTATAGAAAARSQTTTKKAAPTSTKKAAPAPKAPSPKPRKTITTAPKTAAVVSGVKVTPKPTTQRKVITQQPAGQAVQQQFKQAVSSAVKSVGIDFGVATVKTTVQETPTEVITIIDKPEEEVIIEEEVIEEEIPEEIEGIEEEKPELLGESKNAESPKITIRENAVQLVQVRERAAVGDAPDNLDLINTDLLSKDGFYRE